MKEYRIDLIPKEEHWLNMYPEEVTYKVISFTGPEPWVELRRNRWSLRHDAILHIQESSYCVIEVSYSSPYNIDCEKEVQYLHFDSDEYLGSSI